MEALDFYMPTCPVHGLVTPAGECCPGIVSYHLAAHRVLNLTEHPATEEQLAVGMFDLHPKHQEKLKQLLTFSERPPAIEVAVNVELVADLATDVAEAAGCRRVMIDGPAFMLPALERELFSRGLVPVRRSDWC